MPVDDSDIRDSVAELTRLAGAVLGEERAGQLQVALAGRGGQFARVTGALPVNTERPPARSGPEDPTSASVAAGRACRRRISELDHELQAFASVSADEPARARPYSGPDGPVLDGFAIGVKDVIDVAGMPTRSGSPLSAPAPAAEDSVIVSRLRLAGAAILGKTRCTEWALNDPAPTRNPWDGTRTPGGSSAGSAVAVASDMCTATVDTQTAGDVLRPAAYNGVVGLKPSIGWTSLVGVQPVAPTIDTIGVTARSVGAAAAVASAVADVTRDVVPGELPRPVRIGVLHDELLDDATGAVRADVTGVVDRLADAGAVVEEVRPPVDLGLVHDAHRVIAFAECASEHLARYRSQGRNYGPRARALLDLGLVTPAHVYVAAQLVRHEATTRLAKMFDRVEVVVLPVAPRPAPRRDTTGDSGFQVPWTLCGFPALALPSGLEGGLPLAVQLVGALGDDRTLLAVGAWCESILDVHLEPGR